ncbi:glycosyltransferase family 2 protein [Pseudomonas saxonica]|uniref:Glycosyltransferase family 2 protein n=1 Tax=Pseudomonas saxonica TaxID=2600598 RepID=A0A5C5PXT3_9PSED|nr:glycosyltransferase family 2 protein [Pseudomonas saxonica]TWR94138.1 glycosyltransferase family 2 protein [Pseudomonas saxonica]
MITLGLSPKDVAKYTAVIVTTYNPDVVEFKKNLESYCTEVASVIVCDNSDKDDLKQELDKLLTVFPNVQLLCFNQNLGIAEAQNRGIELAASQGAKYFVEMDQDSSLPVDYIVRIIRSYQYLIKAGHSVGGVGPVAASALDGAYYHSRKQSCGLIKVEKTLSSGFFFSLEAYQRVGGKDSDLFIDYVDWDWCWRSNALGMNIFVDTELVMQHMLGEGHKKILFFSVGMPAPIRHYYQYRNGLYMLANKYAPFRWKLERVVILLLKLPVYMFFSGSGKSRRSYIAKAIKDAISGKKGRLVD